MTDTAHKNKRVQEKLQRLFKNYEDSFFEELQPRELISFLKERIHLDKMALIKDLLDPRLKNAEVGMTTEDCLYAIQYLSPEEEPIKLSKVVEPKENVVNFQGKKSGRGKKQ